MNLSMYVNVTRTGKEMMVFNQDQRLMMVLKPAKRGAWFKVHLMVKQGLMDIESELQNFELDALVPMVDKMKHQCTLRDWIPLMREIGRPLIHGRLEDAKKRSGKRVYPARKKLA